MFAYLKEYFDYRTAAVAAALVIAGLIAIYSATYDARASEITYRQLLWAAAGTGALLIMMVLPYRILQFISFPSYFLCMVMLVSVLLIGKTVSGSTSWFNFGALRFQPSEFAKIATILALASYLSRTDVSLRNLKHLLIASGIVLLPVLLILRQPDTGTALIFIGMFFPVLYWGGASRFTLLAFVAPVVATVAALFGTTPFLIAIVVMGVFLYLAKENRLATAVAFSVTVLAGISTQFIYDRLKPYQQKRIATFLDPGADPLGAGYNILQSKVAIGSGGLFGKGYLKGTQTQLNFIPEQWTDFIFCVPGEEFGFVGALVVLLLLTALLVRGVQIASSVKTTFGSFVAIGITAVFGTHVLMNVGMAIGLLPVVGVPLPFLSYGGSALMANMAMVGTLMNLHAHRKEY